ncbi:MAG: DUF5723 family protein [bacterium]|nr:DUF5723 family protein [bacterium]
MKLKFVLILLLGLTISSISTAQSMSTAFTASTVGANVSRVRGIEARFVNPALMGLSRDFKQMIYFPSFAYRFGNNSIHNDQMVKWFQKNRVWTVSERQTLVQAVKNDFRMNGAGYLGLGYQYSNFIAAYDAIGYLDTNIPDEFIDLIAFGNQNQSSYNFGGVRAGAWIGSTISLSFAKSLQYTGVFKELSAGVTLRYMIGHKYIGLNQAYGNFYTTIQPDTIVANGKFVTAQSDQGDGISMDLGMAGKINDKLTVSLACFNLSGKINWDRTTLRENSFSVSDNGIPIDSLHRENFLEDWANYESKIITKNASVSIKLPAFLQIAGDYIVNDDWKIFTSFLQGLNKGRQVVGEMPIGKFAFGGEWSKLTYFPVRSGISLGGNSGFEFGVGFGLRLSNYSMDIAVTYEGGLMNHAKGYGFAFSHQYKLN